MSKHGNKSFKPWQGLHKCPGSVLIVPPFLVIVFLMLLFQNNGKQSSSSIGVMTQQWYSIDPQIQFHPTVEFRNGTDVISQIPDSPKAVLFLAHGCNGRAVNFWDRSPNCSDCVGLPEERLIVLHSLAKKFAVLTISSAGRCWSFGEESLIVKEIIQWWIEKNKFEKLPLVALGASSGGYFVSVLATNLRFSSITLMIAEGMFGTIDITKNYPPTLFVHMPKDRARKQRIAENMEILRNEGIDVAEVKCMEFPLSPYLLADRIPGIDKNSSAQLFGLLHEKGLINGKGYMRKDGRATNWKNFLTKSKIIFPNWRRFVHHIQEELNLAFAYHEMTSLQLEQIFNWFESHMT